MRPLVLQCAAHGARLWASFNLRRSYPALKLSLRHLHATQSHTISVADRIKQFLPADATEDTADPSVQPFETSSDITGPGIAAFTTEMKAIDILVTKGELALACKQLLDQLPLHVVLNALVDRTVPLVAQSPISDLGIYELAYHLHLLDQSALANQLLQSAVGVENHSVQIREFDVVHALTGCQRTAMELDLAVQDHTDMYFPQILQSNHSRWLKTRLLAALSDADFVKVFGKWSEIVLPEIGPSGVALLIKTNRSTVVYDVLKKSVFNTWDESYVNSLVRATSTVEGLSRAWWQLKRRLTDSAYSSTDPVFVSAVPSILKTALRLRQTYDVASICKYGAAQLERHPKLLAKALLAAAFAQKRSNGNNDDIVSSPQDELRTFLVGRVLTSVLSNPAKHDTVVGLAASQLQDLGMSSKVFWQLVISLPTDPKLGRRSSAALASLVSSRPYVEQLRYMALPVVSINSVSELLRLHITRIMNHRRLNRICDSTLQADEDVNLLMAGMLLASEKIDDLDSNKQNRELSKMVARVFEPWQGENPARIISSTAQSEQPVASTIVQQIVGLLVAQKGYTLALQILRLVDGPQRAATLETLLLGIATDMPAKSHSTILWLLRTAKIPVPRHVLNKVLYQLCQCPVLTESQLKNQFQRIRRIMIVYLNSQVDSKAAKALVDAFIESSITRRGGSRLRLRWALDVAKMAKVPKSDFTKWTNRLEVMQEKRQGYWTK